MYPGPFLLGAPATTVKKKASGLTVPQVYLLLMAVLPRRDFDSEWVLEVLEYRQQRNYAAYLSHRKQRQSRLQLLE
jgi:hypothetical protein